MKSNAHNLLNRLHKQKRTPQGFTLVELAAMSLLLVVIVALALDMGILIFASDACDKACKDCARAAGTGRTPGQAMDAMNAALAVHLNGLNSFTMSNLKAQLMVYEDYSLGTPNATSGNGTGPWETTTGTVLPGTSSTSTGTGGTVPGASTQTTVWMTNSTSRTAYSPGPYVVVRCTMTANVPAPIFFFGQSLTPNQIQVASIYSSPLINTYATVLAAAAPVLKNPDPAADAAAATAATTANAASTSTNAAANNTSTNSTTNASTSNDKGSGTSSTSSTSNASHASTTGTTTNSSSTHAASTGNTVSTSNISTSGDKGSGTTSAAATSTAASNSNSTGTAATASASANSTLTNANNSVATASNSSVTASNNTSSGSTTNTVTNASTVSNGANNNNNNSTGGSNGANSNNTVMGQTTGTGGDHG